MSVRTVLTDQRGFTMTEMLMVTTVLAVILGGVILVQQQGQQAYLFGSHRIEVQQNGRAALELMSRELRSALDGVATFRRGLQDLMIHAGIDAWICPSTVGPAPRGLESTGDPIMNLPWTQAGLPVVGLPAGTHATGLPMGLQIVGRWNADEALLACAEGVQRVWPVEPDSLSY